MNCTKRYERRKVHKIQSPCATCQRESRCQMGGGECRKFSDWFENEWKNVTQSIRGDGHNYFVFRLVEKP